MIDSSAPTYSASDEYISYTIEDKDPISRSLSEPRINQQMMLPAAVKARILGDIMGATAPGTQAPTTSSSIQILNGSTQSFLFTVADSQGRAIIAIPEPTVYVGSVDPNNAWPNSTYNMSNVPICVFNDPLKSNGTNVVTRVELRNNTGATINVIAACRWRVIVQPSGSLTEASVNTSVAAIGA